MFAVWTLTSSRLRIVSNILIYAEFCRQLSIISFNACKFIDIVCECDEQTDGQTYNNDITRCTVRMMTVIKYFY